MSSSRSLGLNFAARPFMTIGTVGMMPHRLPEMLSSSMDILQLDFGATSWHLIHPKLPGMYQQSVIKIQSVVLVLVALSAQDVAIVLTLPLDLFQALTLAAVLALALALNIMPDPIVINMSHVLNIALVLTDGPDPVPQDIAPRDLVRETESSRASVRTLLKAPIPMGNPLHLPHALPRNITPLVIVTYARTPGES